MGTTERGYVDLNWGQVHYRAAGDPASPLLVILHQTPLSSRQYERVLPLLGTRLRAVALDSPGYGMSGPPPAEWSVSEYAAAMWLVVNHLGAERILLLGRATGSVLALEAAIQQPDRVGGLVLHGLPVYTTCERTERLDSDFGEPFRVRPDGSHLTEIWERIRGQYPTLPADTVQTHLEDYLATGGDFAPGYRAIWRYDLEQAVTGLRVPTLLLGGTRDRVYPFFDRARKVVPEARHHVFDDGSDFIAAEDPSLFVATVLDFLLDH